MSVLTPTEREARLSVRDTESGLVVLAEKLRKKADAKNILLKIGEDGVLIHAEISASESWITDRIPALNPLPVDVAGAGDSMMITSAMALAVGATIWEAAALGSIAASVQVSRIGNIPIQREEIIKNI
jgi:bifunctional ADP-heptose synthase (sugar kinase/adenylyltransferase)